MDPQYFHVQFVIILISITIGYVVWTYNSKSHLNRLLTLIIICVLINDISLLLQLKADRDRYTYWIIVLGSIGISFFTPLFYTLSLYYPTRRSFDRKHLTAIYVLAFVFCALIVSFFPEHLITDKLPFPATIRRIAEVKLPLPFLLLFFFLTSYSVLLLVLTLRNFLASLSGEIIPYEKNSVRLLIAVGSPLAYLLTIVDVVNYFFNIPFPWIGFFLGFFTLFIVVLVLRFHLVDMKRLLNGILFYPAIIAILVFIYISVLLRNQESIARMLDLPVNIALLLEVFIIYLAVTTMRRFFDFSFLTTLRLPIVSSFRTRSNSLAPLEFLSYAQTVQDLHARVREVFRTYHKLDGAHLLLREKGMRRFSSSGMSGRDGTVRIEITRELLVVLHKLDRGITLEELLIHINTREDIRALHWMGMNLILPIIRGDDIMALILLPKRSVFERWSYDEIRSLNYLRFALPALIDRCDMYEKEKEIEKHEFRMEQMMVMGQLASGLAHEIRNPLSIISTSVETILKGRIPEQDRQKMLRYIQEETDRINILAEKLLSINSQPKPQFEEVELAAVFSKLQTFVSYKLREKSIAFEVKKNAPLRIYSDPDILFQIFLNLSLNSIEALTAEGSIRIDYGYEGDAVFVYHRDDGPGIPREYRDSVFEPFFTTKREGSGLGLTVSRKLVEQLHGSLELVPSRKGTVFKITLRRLQGTS
jgi:signal transduction histidine kinase